MMQGHIPDWVGHWLLRMDDNSPDDANDTCHLLWASHCAQHFPLIILLNITNRLDYYPHFRGKRTEAPA